MISKAAVPYVVPFAVFVGLLAFFGGGFWRPTLLAEQWIRVGVMVAVLWLVARPALDFHADHWSGSLAVGAAVFVIWIMPDLLSSSYRQLWLFHNALVGSVRPVADPGLRTPLALALRTFRAVAVVPIVEELFWRAWLMRWIIRPDFQSVPLGSYSPLAFWIVAILFAAEHGPFWDVGLAAGIIFNLWMMKTRRLGDLILAHATANACLSAYVTITGRWQYWQ